MIHDFKNMPLKNPNQTLIDYTESLTEWYVSIVPTEERKHKGQYFTPGKISELMVKQFQNFNKYENISILDPGAGLGIFESAICEYLKFLGKHIRLFFDIYENDTALIPLLEYNMKVCKKDMEAHGFEIFYNIIQENFLLSDSHNSFGDKTIKKYDLVISNPPYYKISAKSPLVQHMKNIMNGQPNIYPFFMAISAELLKPGGQITLLTPRSYCSGLYFKNFRNWFFDIVKPCKIHLFESRKELFKNDDVFQENIILTAIKTKDIQKNIQICVSKGIPSADSDIKKRNSAYSNVVCKRQDDIFIRIPTSETDELIATHIDKYKDNLKSLGFKISTGKVVPFRARKFLCYGLTECEKSVPLIWMQNIIDGTVIWPIKINKKSIKIKVSGESKKFLIPNENYIFIKRLSSKGGKRHINSASYFKKHLNADFIGVENHVNYISKKEGTLTERESYGIVALLNSSIYNKYFQIGNGTTQVNAKEISNIPLPPIDLIKELGDSIIELKQNTDKTNSSIQEELIIKLLNIKEEISINLP